MVENLHFRRNKIVKRAYRALEGSATKIVPIVPKGRSQIVPNVPCVPNVPYRAHRSLWRSYPVYIVHSTFP